jgi:glucose/arabinose dehydrogenase
MKKTRLLRWTTGTLLVVLLALIGFVWFGPVTVGNKKILLDFLLGRGIAPLSAAQAAERLKVADGFKVDIYAKVPLARWPLATTTGDLIVARTRGDAIFLLERDRNGDGQPDAIRTLVEKIDHPHGLAVHEGWLYIGHRTGIARIQFDEATGNVKGTPTNIVDDFAGDGNHTTKTVGFGSDGWLYVTQGSSCNVCIEKDERRATMMRMRPDGTEREIYATGLRNSVGFDWAPWDGAIYATDNGRDLLGDDFPPCELNRVERGKFFGWPYVNGNNVVDPDFGTANPTLAAQAVPPVHGFRAHNAPLGIHFLRGNVPAGYERTALVALHGSWNRSKLDGYKVVALDFADDGSVIERNFLTGFLGADGAVYGRPAGVTQGPDGAIYVTDDYAGVVYRVTAVDTTSSQ